MDLLTYLLIYEILVVLCCTDVFVIVFSWFDSSRSLMEQGVTENSIVLFRYKFYAHYDISPKVRDFSV